MVHHTSDHLDLYNTWASFSFNGTASEWTDTQTINFATDAVPAYNSQDTWSTPSLPELPVAVILALFAVIPLIAIAFRKRGSLI
jgi:hypothetical protein